MRVGILSDTHGMLRAEIFERFAGVDHILHAGDVGSAGLLVELEAIAPVLAVWGNTDGFELRGRVPEVVRTGLGGVATVVVHGHQNGSPTPERLALAYPDAGLIVFGHTHRPVIQRVGEALVVNPGGAGAPRFGVGPSVVLAEIADGRASAHLVALDPARR